MRAALLFHVHAQLNAPKWISTLPHSTIKLTCDVWEANELLARQKRKPVTNADIARHMMLNADHASRSYDGLCARIGEAQVRISRLQNSIDDQPIWPEFEVELHFDPRGDC